MKKQLSILIIAISFASASKAQTIQTINGKPSMVTVIDSNAGKNRAQMASRNIAEAKKRLAQAIQDSIQWYGISKNQKWNVNYDSRKPFVKKPH